MGGKMNIFNRLKDWADSRGISKQDVSQNDWVKVRNELLTLHLSFKNMGVKGYVLNIVEELTEYSEAMLNDDINEVVDAICDVEVFSATELVKMGFDIEKSYNEVLKIIESRTGRWDDNLGKFVKDYKPETWYNADYVKNCKAYIDKTGNIFDNYELNCRYCGAMFTNMMAHAEHEDICFQKGESFD
jgi:hypothetical protein